MGGKRLALAALIACGWQPSALARNSDDPLCVPPALSADQVQNLSCWMQPVNNPAALLNKVKLQFWVTGLNHSNGADCPHHPAGQACPAVTRTGVAEVARAMFADWPGTSQIIALTGIDALSACPGCGLSDDYLQRQLWMRGHWFDVRRAANSRADRPALNPTDWRWGTISTPVEFSLLSPDRWSVSGQSVTKIDDVWFVSRGTHYAFGVYQALIQDTCPTGIKFRIFITHIPGTTLPDLSADRVKGIMRKVIDVVAGHGVASDEYAPLLVGDFNGADSDPDMQALLGHSFDLSEESVTCAGGRGPRIPFNGQSSDVIRIYPGSTTTGSAFANTRGRLVVIRRSYAVEQDGSVGHPGGISLPEVGHTLRGVGLTVEDRPVCNNGQTWDGSHCVCQSNRAPCGTGCCLPGDECATLANGCIVCREPRICTPPTPRRCEDQCYGDVTCVKRIEACPAQSRCPSCD